MALSVRLSVQLAQVGRWRLGHLRLRNPAELRTLLGNHHRGAANEARYAFDHCSSPAAATDMTVDRVPSFFQPARVFGIHAHYRSRDNSSAARIWCASLDQSPAFGSQRYS